MLRSWYSMNLPSCASEGFWGKNPKPSVPLEVPPAKLDLGAGKVQGRRGGLGSGLASAEQAGLRAGLALSELVGGLATALSELVGGLIGTQAGTWAASSPELLGAGLGGRDPHDHQDRQRGEDDPCRSRCSHDGLLACEGEAGRMIRPVNIGVAVRAGPSERELERSRIPAVRPRRVLGRGRGIAGRAGGFEIFSMDLVIRAVRIVAVRAAFHCTGAYSPQEGAALLGVARVARQRSARSP